MKGKEQLREALRRIDGKPYGFYRDLKGSYDFGGYTLVIDYVQRPLRPPQPGGGPGPPDGGRFPRRTV
ncbi:MAG: ABC-ATPase domain-containing protein [Candidatus Erginobacter occultus]|nr:ABC-ATPase domain-containing protein [Candidatus Erginobacter occultus]